MKGKHGTFLYNLKLLKEFLSRATINNNIKEMTDLTK